MTDEWTMADGFAPVSRLHYCEHPKACSAPATGRCPRCQVPLRARAAFQRYNKRVLAAPLKVSSVPTYVDGDFDEMEG